jgi:hypothetical protein
MAFAYNSPFVISASAFFFLIFTSFRFYSPNINFIASSAFAVYLIPLLDGLSAWFLTWVEAKKAKQSEIINQINVKMRQAAASAEDDSPKRLIGFCRDDDYKEEEDEEDEI